MILKSILNPNTYSGSVLYCTRKEATQLSHYLSWSNVMLDFDAIPPGVFYEDLRDYLRILSEYCNTAASGVLFSGTQHPNKALIAPADRRAGTYLLLLSRAARTTFATAALDIFHTIPQWCTALDKKYPLRGLPMPGGIRLLTELLVSLSNGPELLTSDTESQNLYRHIIRFTNFAHEYPSLFRPERDPALFHAQLNACLQMIVNSAPSKRRAVKWEQYFKTLVPSCR